VNNLALQNSENTKIHDIAVLGAGMVGISCAQWLQKNGCNPVLIDREKPGNGASYGNACTFASYGCVPINNPSIPLQIPKLIFGKNSPLNVKWQYLPTMLPWLTRFLVNCQPSRVKQIAHDLAQLLNASEDAAKPLFDDANVHSLINRAGCLYLYETERNYNQASHDLKLRRENGVNMEVLEQGAVLEIEPELANCFYNAIHFPDAFNFADPRAVIQKMSRHFENQGGTFKQTEITQITKSADNILSLHHKNGSTIHCRQLVMALGAWSKKLFGNVVESLPLETERGYHVVFHGQENLLSRPIGWGTGGFYLTPMDEGLRVAGTVELGGMSPIKRGKTLDFMTNEAKRILPALNDQRDDDWLGFRPSFPDALPVIGRSKKTPEIILAFGHQHLGITLGPITGKIVSEIAKNKPRSLDITPYRPNRF